MVTPPVYWRLTDHFAELKPTVQASSGVTNAHRATSASLRALLVVPSNSPASMAGTSLASIFDLKNLESEPEATPLFLHDFSRALDF